jgi:hypothetical protein
MVLIGRQEAFAKLRGDRALAALITILFDHTGLIDAPTRISQTDDAVIATLSSIQSREEGGFREAAAMLSRRKISVDSDWVHDDLLAFAMIVGNLCFGGCNKLIETLLRARLSGNDDDRNQKISQSLRTLADSQDDAPYLSVLIVGRMLAYPSGRIDGKLLSNAHEQSAMLEIDPTTKEFLRLLGEKVADVAIRIGSVDHASEYSRLKVFRTKFDRRSTIFGHVVFLVMVLGIAALWVSVAKLYFSSEKESEEFAGKLFQMGVVVGPIALLLARKKILVFLRSLFYSILGGGELLESNSVK